MPARPPAGALRSAALAAALAFVLLPRAARPGSFSSVAPEEVRAGSFYAGATLHVRGTVGADAQVAIRVTGPVEHHTFNRRGKIGGLVWGGIEHVTFEHAPSLYAVYTSAALGTIAPPALRAALHLGYDTFEGHVNVRGTHVEPRLLIAHFVKLKESEGLYRLAPGAVHLDDAVGGERMFDAAVAIPATATPGDIEITVFELAGGAVVHEDLARVPLRRVGMPAFLFRLAHARSAVMGLLAVFVLLATGVAVDLLGYRRHALHPHPAVVLLVGLARGVHGAVRAKPRARSAEDVERFHAQYWLFRKLLSLNSELLELLADLEEESSWTSFRHARVRMGIRALFDGTADLVSVLNELTGQRYFDLANVVGSLRADVRRFLDRPPDPEGSRLTIALREIGSTTADLVGDKAFNLARVECDLGLRVPASFVVTVEAYREFLDAEGLGSQLRTILAPARLDVPADLRRRCETAQALVRDAAAPASVVEAIERARREAGLEDGEGLAVRSCAAGEGGTLSFAGQFETLLNVPASAVVDAWKRVVSSRYAPRALFYRRAAGLADVDTPMAVLVQRMVPAHASGVLFTRPPDAPRGATLLVHATRGLGPEVSEGTADADELEISRTPPHAVVERRIGANPVSLEAADGGGIARIAVTAGAQRAPALDDAGAARLAEAALAMERYFGAPQDVEWAVDRDGTLFVLQARPLRAEVPREDAADVEPASPLLARGGQPVWPGRAVGAVHLARTQEEEEETPLGALLVVPQLHPDCVRLLPRVCGIVTEHGTVTGHAASIVREFRVPTLFGVPDALERLEPGRTVSLDVAGRRVLDGAAWPELRGRLPVALHAHREGGLPELLAGKITKLGARAFVGTWTCRSLHDVIRFAHEMAIRAMFDVGDRLLDSPVGAVKVVDCPPPVYVHVVDLGGGIRAGASSNRKVDPEEIVSAPFQGLWRGLADAQFRPRRPEAPHPSGAALAISLEQARSVELGAPNYACITDTYMNLNTRAGIERDPLRARPRRQASHYAIVDSFLSDNPNENHVRMRLRGGGANPAQRRLRASLAAELLRLHHLTATVTGDLMNAWVRGVDRATGMDALATIGHLLRFLVRLDMSMEDEADVKRWFEAFVEAEAAALVGSRGPRGIASA